MRLTNQIIISAIIGLIVFGTWGIYTPSGNRHYDEMDGIIPFLSIVGGIILAIILIVINLVRTRLKRNKARP